LNRRALVAVTVAIGAFRGSSTADRHARDRF
jgi:hypothetical protein